MTMFTKFLIPLISCTVSCLITAHGENLIVNGDAETGTGSADGFTPVAIPGWALVGDFRALQYDIGGGFPASSDPGPASRGLNFFAGGPNNAYSSASQVIDLSPLSVSIDLGAVAFTLSGYFGGFESQDDNALLKITFRDSGGGTLATEAIGGVTAADRGGATGLLFRDSSGIIPVGTRDALLLLEMTRTQGSYNDGYADNLSLEIAIIPEPTPIALFVFGSLGLGFAACRHIRR